MLYECGVLVTGLLRQEKTLRLHNGLAIRKHYGDGEQTEERIKTNKIGEEQ